MGGANSGASVRLVVHSSDMSKAVPPRGVSVLTAEINRKPLIGFLWVGTILLFIGLAISMYRRFTEETVARKLSSVKLPVENKQTEVQGVEN